MRNIYLLFLIILLVTAPDLSFCQPGIPDQTFGVNGKVITGVGSDEFEANAIAIQADGKLIAAGHSNKFSTGVFAVVRYHTNGKPDSSFAVNGIFIVNTSYRKDEITSVAIQSDGKIVVAGYQYNTSGSNRDFILMRLNANGTIDNGFGVNGITITDIASGSEDELYNIIILPSGKIIAGGFVEDGALIHHGFAIVQYNTDGTIDPSFGSAGKAVTTLTGQDDGGSITLQPDGKIIAGSSKDTGSLQKFAAVRFRSDGNIDSTFGNNGLALAAIGTGNDHVNDITLQADGKVLLTGTTAIGAKLNIGVVRFDTSGAIDNTFGINGTIMTAIGNSNDEGLKIHAQPDGKILVTGNTNVELATQDFALIRYNSNGTADSLFGKHGIVTTDFNNDEDENYASLIQPDGKIVLAGKSEDNNDEGFALARYENDFGKDFNIIAGYVYADDNYNGQYDGGESLFTGAGVISVKGADTIFAGSSQGLFALSVDTGSYQTMVINYPSYYQSLPAAFSTSHNTYFNTDTIYFALQPLSPLRNVSVYLAPLSMARPGFNTAYKIIYKNNGTDTMPSGTVEFIKNSRTGFVSSSVIPAFISGDTLRWNIADLHPQDTGSIVVYLSVPPSVAIGDTLSCRTSVYNAGADVMPADNASILVQQTGNIINTNEVEENHGGYITTGQVAAGDYLQYTLLFRNTNTDTALNVFIRDTLSSKLNWNTLETISSSHNYTLTRSVTGACLWVIGGANLAGNANTGYISFRIKPKSSVIAGDTVLHSASIYFNNSLPVRSAAERTLVVANALPLKLLSFIVTKQDRHNILQWSTAQEINVNTFEIERSSNGREFIPVGRMPAGHGRYSFTDFEPLKQVNYYRLKMIDKDGRYQYSAIRSMDNGRSLYVSLYANPVNDVLRMNIDAIKPGLLQLQVVSPDGKMLMSSKLAIAEGVYIKNLNIQSLNKGSYFLRIVAEDNQQAVLQFEKL